MAEFADNNAISTATGVSPFFSNKGFNPRMSFTPDPTLYTTTRQRLDAARAGDISKKMEEILGYISTNMEDARRAMAEQANKHRQDAVYEPGTMVFLSTKHITTDRPSKKLDHKRVGPFEVIERVGSSYKLRLPSTMKIHNVFHPSLLSPAHTDPLPGQKNSPPNPVIIEDEEEWTVEDILDSKRVRNKLKY